MKWIILLVAICACRNKDDGWRAKGTLVFDAREAADVFLATEAEVMKSEAILKGVREQARLEIAPAAIFIARRTGTMVVDVSVRDKDPQRAADMCNHLMRAYIEYRLGMAHYTHAHAQEALHAALEKDPNNAEVQRKIAELDVKRITTTSDVRVLDPCLIPKGKTK